MKKFAVLGNPISHSKSPEIHMAFAKQFGISLKYERKLVTSKQFFSFATEFFQHANGANVTVPLKEQALRFALELSEDAELAGAVNTLSRNNGRIIGDNTDGIGLVRDIRDNHGYSFSHKRVLIIGAGGAARGIILPIAKENPATITIVNRTRNKADQLARKFSHYVAIESEPIETLNCSFDIIINATSASLSGQQLRLPSKIFSATSLCYDIMYAREPTDFMKSAQQHGSTAVDGLGMLVEQAAKSFEIWHGIAPETETIIKKIRSQL